MKIHKRINPQQLQNELEARLGRRVILNTSLPEKITPNTPSIAVLLNEQGEEIDQAVLAEVLEAHVAEPVLTPFERTQAMLAKVDAAKNVKDLQDILRELILNS